ncbi:MAG: SIR2 family protein [Rhodospirillales bacterium]
MRLDYDIDRESVDAKQRDAFRKEVQDWDQGIFVAQFNLARDLAEGVGEAVIKLLTDRFLRTKIESRIAEADAVSSLLQQERPHAVGDVQVPRLLSAAVTKREAVLFAGAGISAAAGLPSAGVFSSAVARVIRECVPDYGVSPVASMFSAIASDVEAFASRELLVHEVKSIVNPPHGLQPTTAHQAAVRLFDLILTSNWDALFERAAEAAGIDLPIIIGEISDPLPTRCLVKLHGTPEEPESLMLSEDDILLMDKTRKRLCEEVRSVLKNRILVVIGSSLRDPSIVKLFIEAAPQCQNYFISPSITDASTARLRKWNFTPIVADADSFMKALATGV